MELSWTTYLIVCPLIFIGSLVDAIAGGGGLITLPAYLLAGLPPHNAIATNKLSSSIGTLASTGRFIKNRCIDWPLAIPSAILAVLGSMLGAELILTISENTVRWFMLGILPIAAFVVLRERDLDAHALEPISRRKQFLIVILFSLVVGAYDGFYGPGTGTFLLLAFTQLGHMPLRNAAGNVKIANLSSNVGSVVVFLLRGQAIIPLGLAAAAFSLVGHFIGAGALLKRGTKIVRPFILAVLGLLFVRLVYDIVTGA